MTKTCGGRTTRFAPALVLFPLLLLSTPAMSQERKISRADLPPAVAQAVAHQAEGAVLRGLSQELDKGQIYYEAEWLVQGRTRDVLMDTTGAIVEVEEQVDLDSLPVPVKAGLAAKAGAGRILQVESLTKRGQLVAYEAQVKAGTKRTEIQVGPDGAALPQE